MKPLHEKLREAAQKISNQTNLSPKVGVILGSGLGAFTQKIQNAVSLRFDEIPHFLPTSVEGHQGKLVVGTLGPSQMPVAVLAGRLHYYEGHTMEEVVLPARTLCSLGVQTLVLTNASGGVNPAFREGDMMLVTDHMNLMGSNPLLGPNPRELGPRFPDLSEAYDSRCQQILRTEATKLHLTLKEGIYAAVSGPTYETPAEVRMLRLLGADAVGMSTVPEVIAANHLGVRVAAVSCIANLAAGLTSRKLSHTDVVTNASRAACSLMLLLEAALPKLSKI